jgi:hypothetical protein
VLILLKRGGRRGGGESVEGVKGAMGVDEEDCWTWVREKRGDRVDEVGMGWGGDDDDGVWISDVGKEGRKGVQRCCEGVADNDRDVGLEEESGAVVIDGWRRF